ncbi:major facilitator superfamily domain-containing protein [Diaporthe sp. PMI_573]|nr:major facilitator superfamily domain-containing protein [Diaporthaceae sp. PMI_573]
MATDEQSPLIGHNGMSTIGSNGQDLEHQTSPGPQKLSQQQLWLTIGFPYVGLLLVAMATAATQPLIGRLSDLYGRRFNLFASTFLFTLGNVLCGVSSFIAVGGVPLLITGRIIAGAGGGAMNAIAAFIATDLVPLDRRAVWTGIADVIWAAGIGVGGVVGGAVHDWVGWPWAFFCFVPLSLLVLVGVYFTLPPADPLLGRDDSDDNSRIDYPGTASLVSAIVCLTLGLNLAEQGDYIPPLSWTLLAVSTVLFVCFAIVGFSHATHSPFIPILLLRDRTVAMVCASAVLVAASMHSLLYYVPFWIQVRGYSASQVGVQMLGELVGASLGSLTTGLLIKRLGGYGLIKPVVFLVFAVAPLVLP